MKLSPRGLLRLNLHNADVLPPGQGRAVGVDVVGLMPAGSDVLLALSSLVSS